MTPQHYCHHICKKSGSNFVHTFYFFGKKRRRALEAFYAFCRKVDDAVDLVESEAQGDAAIRFWREETGRIYQGKAEHPVGKALSEVVQSFAIPQNYLEAIADGCAMDLHNKTYATFAELETYCYRVASCVGLVCLRLFGVPPTERAEQAAIALGKALQLTNILRDIVTDLGRQRVYLPQEDLERFQVRVEDLGRARLGGAGGDNLNLLDLFYFEIERARAFFTLAWTLFPKTLKARRRLLAASVMGRVYERLLDKISHNPLQVFQKKVVVTRREKCGLVWQELLKCMGL